jgi:excisionase family DNA binding protein
MTTRTHIVTSQNPDQLLTASQAASLLAVHISTVRRWIKQGKLPAYRVGDKGVRVRSVDVTLLLTPLASGPEKGGRMKAATKLVPRHLTADEQQQAFAAIEGARKLQAEIREERGGQLFPDSTELIREMREERSAELMRALDE